MQRRPELSQGKRNPHVLYGRRTSSTVLGTTLAPTPLSSSLRCKNADKSEHVWLPGNEPAPTPTSRLPTRMRKPSYPVSTNARRRKSTRWRLQASTPEAPPNHNSTTTSTARWRIGAPSKYTVLVHPHPPLLNLHDVGIVNASKRFQIINKHTVLFYARYGNRSMRRGLGSAPLPCAAAFARSRISLTVSGLTPSMVCTCCASTCIGVLTY